MLLAVAVAESLSVVDDPFHPDLVASVIGNTPHSSRNLNT